MPGFWSVVERIRLSDFSWGSICYSSELIAGFWLSSDLNHPVVKRIHSGYLELKSLHVYQGINWGFFKNPFHVLCISIGIVCTPTIFQQRRIWSQCFLDPSGNTEVWDSKGGAILLGCLPPALNMLAFCLQLVGEANKFSTKCLAVAPNQKVYTMCFN